MSASSRSLADAIRAFDAQQLAVLLRARPDLTQPRPLDLSELIERLSARASTLRALDRLDAWHLLVAQAVAAWEGGGDPVDDKQLAAAMGLPDDVAAVDRALDGLRQLGLAWGSPVHLTQAARAAFGEHPGGLAAVSPTPLAPATIDEALRAVGEAGRAVLDRLVWGPPTGTVQRADRAATRESAESTMDLLLAWGLLRPIGPDQVLLPREVALRLRGGRLVRQPVPTQVPAWQAPTSATGASLPASLVDRAAIGSAQELTSHVVAVLDDIAARTPRALATGGVPKREMGTFTRLVDDARLAEFVIGITRGAGLFTTRGGLLMPTTGLDDFLDLDAFARWLLVRDAWRSLTWWPADLDAAGRAPAEEMTGSSASSRAASQRAAGQRPTGQPEPGAHGDAPTHPGLPTSAALREAAWDELVAATRGTAVVADSLAERLSWRHPAWLGVDWPGVARQLVREAEWLGLMAFGRTTGLLDATRSTPDPGFTAYGDRFVLQSDLTAVAPAPLDHDTAALIGVMANRESHGAAATYRFTPASLERALDAGWSVQDISEWLTTHNESGADAGLPAPLTSLLDDVARQHGKVRLMTLGAVVQLDDPATEASLLADPRAEDLGLIALAPGVLGAAAEPAELVAFLRQRGLAPVAQSSQGVQITTPPSRRAPAPACPVAPPPVDADALAAALLRRESTGLSPEQIVQALTRAYRDDLWVGVDWADDNGATHSHTMRVLSMGSGVVNLVRRAAGRLSLPVTRIIAVDIPASADAPSDAGKAPSDT